MLPRFDGQFIRVDRFGDAAAQAIDWIRENTSLDATFVCEPHSCYSLVAGMTGRKCLFTSKGHMNPSADVERRLRDLKVIMYTTDARVFATIAARYGVSHVPFLGPPRAHLCGFEPCSIPGPASRCNTAPRTGLGSSIVLCPMRARYTEIAALYHRTRAYTPSARPERRHGAVQAWPAHWAPIRVPCSRPAIQTPSDARILA